MTQNAPDLGMVEFDKIAQLIAEMDTFPPKSFTDENILAWSKYFNVAPKDLSAFTTQISRILFRAEQVVRYPENPIPPLQDPTLTGDLPEILSPEGILFLWWKVLIILAQEANSDALEAHFKDQFLLAAYELYAEHILSQIKRKTESV